MKNMLDLRFVIGAFFLIVGILLLGSSFMVHFTKENGTTVNRDCGVVFILFSLIMLAMWKWGTKPTEEA